MRHIVFIIAYIFFLYKDFKRREIDLYALAIYAVIALIVVALTKSSVTYEKLIDSMYSIAFGLVIYILSYFSREGIGLGDGIYFVINGLLLSLKENIMLFFTGLFVAFIIGVFLYYFGNERAKKDVRLPFMPCILPAVIGYILCIV